MSHVPHQLNQDFPEHSDLISRLKANDAHFSRLAEEYQEVNGVIHRAETDVEPMEDLHVAELRKKRMVLKDEIARLLSDAANV